MEEERERWSMKKIEAWTLALILTRQYSHMPLNLRLWLRPQRLPQRPPLGHRHHPTTLTRTQSRQSASGLTATEPTIPAGQRNPKLTQIRRLRRNERAMWTTKIFVLSLHAPLNSQHKSIGTIKIKSALAIHSARASLSEVFLNRLL